MAGKKRTQEEQRLIREAAFRWLDAKQADGQWEFTRDELQLFFYRGDKISLMDRHKGIRNPAEFSTTLSVMTSAQETIYEDGERSDGLIRYSYEDGVHGSGGSNKKLKQAFIAGDPLIYFRGVGPGLFTATYPAYIVADVPGEHHVLLSFVETEKFDSARDDQTEIERSYLTRETRVRLHQRAFRARVLNAYNDSCALCGMPFPELLDAAHIVSDSTAGGIAHISNGIALCKLHHAAYDRHLLGITPELSITVAATVLQESGPELLRVGLQQLHGMTMRLPKSEKYVPSPQLLAEAFRGFEAAQKS